MVVSEKFIIDINMFMENYLGVMYDGEYKLTHGEMKVFLIGKKRLCPVRCEISRIKDCDVRSGRYLFVKDESNKIVPYLNPNRDSIRVEDLCKDQKELARRRLETLNREIDYENIGSIDYVEYSIARANKPKTRSRVIKRVEN